MNIRYGILLSDAGVIHVELGLTVIFLATAEVKKLTLEEYAALNVRTLQPSKACLLFVGDSEEYIRTIRYSEFCKKFLKDEKLYEILATKNLFLQRLERVQIARNAMYAYFSVIYKDSGAEETQLEIQVSISDDLMLECKHYETAMGFIRKRLVDEYSTELNCCISEMKDKLRKLQSYV